MERSYILLTLCLLSLISWDLKKDKNNIKVYTQKVEGSSFKAFKAETVMDATLTELTAIVADIKACPKWIDTCESGKLIKRISQTESINHTLNGAPWPVSDRDAVVRTTISQDKTTLEVTIITKSEIGAVPESKGIVRVKGIDAIWKFTPISKGRTKLLYQVHNDPGGSLPAILVNSAAINQPYKTILNMKKETKAYSNVKLPFITNMK